LDDVVSSGNLDVLEWFVKGKQFQSFECLHSAAMHGHTHLIEWIISWPGSWDDDGTGLQNMLDGSHCGGRTEVIVWMIEHQMITLSDEIEVEVELIDFGSNTKTTSLPGYNGGPDAFSTIKIRPVREFSRMAITTLMESVYFFTTKRFKSLSTDTTQSVNDFFVRSSEKGNLNSIKRIVRERPRLDTELVSYLTQDSASRGHIHILDWLSLEGLLVHDKVCYLFHFNFFLFDLKSTHLNPLTCSNFF
jgi:hypothetical protein